MKDTKNILEAVLMAANEPLSMKQLIDIFHDRDVTKEGIQKCIDELNSEYLNRAIEINKVASGFRIQVKQDFSDYVSKLSEERPPRYSRALLETLALIAYRQPITRGEIEEVRGVAVSTHIIKTLLDREWIREIGHKDVPGKPALFGTTKYFLDDFNLKSLSELPTLSELRDLDEVAKAHGLQLELVETMAEVVEQENESAELELEVVEQENESAERELEVVEEATE